MLEDLARRFEVSAQTIRKDLNDLCDHHVLTRIHGGAIIASGVENLAYEARRFVAAEEKKAIGAAAAARAGSPAATAAPPAPIPHPSCRLHNAAHPADIAPE